MTQSGMVARERAVRAALAIRDAATFGKIAELAKTSAKPA